MSSWNRTAILEHKLGGPAVGNRVQNARYSGQFAHGTADLKLDPALSNALSMMTHGAPLETDGPNAMDNVEHHQNLLHRNLLASKGVGVGPEPGQKRKRARKAPQFAPAIRKGLAGPRKLTKKGGTTFTRVTNTLVQPGARV